MLRLPQFLHLYLVSNTIMSCNKYKKFHDGRQRICGTTTLWTPGKIPRSPKSFCFSPKTCLSRIVTSCYIVYSKTKVLLPAAIEVCGLTGICCHQSSFKQFFCSHSTGFYYFALFPAMTIVQRKSKPNEKNLSWLSTKCNANFRHNIGWDFIQLTH